MAPRLVRRRPLADRIKAYLNPLDILLWLSEELDSSDWDQWQKGWATPVGIFVNLVFLIARANSASKGRGRGRGDDVFSEDVGYTSWLAWFAAFIVHLLTLGAFMNAAYTFHRRRHYRLFESSVDAVPSTSSAHRVRVNSSPIASSPLRFLSNMLAGESANARAHPDASRDVWEIAVWDPTPISLRMFCLFSPGHVLVYWLFLPTAISDPRPSTTVITTMILAGLLSAQLLLLQSNFSQQSKDASVIHKEVMNEYDTKYVHPRTQPLMRDVGTQYSTSEAVFNWSASRADLSDSVDVYPPTFIINRGFHTKPNPAYARYVDPEGSSSLPHQSRGAATRFTSAVHTPLHLRDASSPIRPQTTIRQPQFRPNGVGDGGSLGVFSHANSPLRKSASVNFSGSYERQERSSSPVKRESSPMKRGSLAPMPNGRRSGHMPDSTTRRESGKY